MRLPGVRFAMRRMSIAAAVIAVILGVDQMRRSVLFSRERVEFFKEEEDRYLRMAIAADEADVATRPRKEEFRALVDSVSVPEGERRASARCPGARGGREDSGLTPAARPTATFRDRLSEEGEELAARNPALFRALSDSASRVDEFGKEARRCRDRARWCGAARAVYERAILRPWGPIPIEPDPPEAPQEGLLIGADPSPFGAGLPTGPAAGPTEGSPPSGPTDEITGPARIRRPHPRPAISRPRA